MPALDARMPATPGWLARGIVLCLAAALLLTADLAAPSTARATNWSHRIAAIRGSQVYYESVMHGADLQLRKLKHAARRGQHRLARARRNLAQAREQRAVALARHRVSTAQLETARTRLAGQVQPPATPDDLASLAMLPAISSPEAIPAERAGSEDDGEDGDARSAPGAAPAFDGFAAAGPALVAMEVLSTAPDPVSLPGPSAPTEAVPGVSVAALLEQAASTVRRLEAEASQHERAVDRGRRKVHRVTRSVNTKARSIHAIRGAMRSAAARRGGAEGGLANAILAMSDLAQRRVVKKTDVRPGRGSPFAWPTQGRLVQGYGCTGFHLNPARGSCSHFHDGIDIAGYLGTPIRAAAVGVVSYIGWNPWDHEQRAFMVVVAHPGGLETLYAHVLPRRDVRVGQLVRRGELIGYMGSTGMATGVHLHLEIRRGRTTLDPLAFL